MNELLSHRRSWDPRSSFNRAESRADEPAGKRSNGFVGVARAASLYANLTVAGRIRHGGLTGVDPSSDRPHDRSIAMIIDTLFLLGGLALFGLAGLAVSDADRL
ncbi:hypothetical protein [Bosea sp. (in: a-proteobacteria)]|uniref:hypothetical protein n=1 Tax=Bosea sp. (in: a-proteobacteria) TaxID=1871050 RepID=UPI0025BC5979|nr:hypothetical protein [Bosea sp. (in: a-proteobacteria)]